MAKRKATSPLEAVNGDDDVHCYSIRHLDSTATPKRALGSGISVVPSSLTFDTSPTGRQKYINLDDDVSDKMTKVNESFISSLAVTLSEHPDVILFPMVESYIRHVHAILTPHLPKYLTVLDDEKSFASLARFLDKFKTSIGKLHEISDIIMKSPENKATVTSSKPIVTERRSSAAGASVVADEKPTPSVFANFKFKPSASTDAPFKDVFDGLKSASNSKSLVPPSTSTSISGSTGFKLPSFGFDKTHATPKTNGIIPSIFSSAVGDKLGALGGVSGSGLTFSMPKPQTVIDVGSSCETQNEDEPSEEPPKNEFKQVKEDDALYEVRCKVFGKPADGEYKMKGLGQLYVKKLDNGKHQVVVRAENNLGTILLNILLQKGLPLYANANSVITTDPVGDNGKPMMMLIRVKTEAAANELLKKLQGFAAQS